MPSLTQKKLFNGKREFTINDGKSITSKYSSISSANEETIELFKLDIKYERIVYRELKYLVITVPLLLIGLNFLYDAIHFPDPVPYAIAGMFLIPGAISIFYFFICQQDQIIIRYHQSQNAALIFWRNRPNKEEFDIFIAELITETKKQTIDPNLNYRQKLEIYAKYLEFLANENVLTEQEAQKIYDRTENRLKKESSSSVVSLVK